MSGVTIGDGAVVGACSVLTKDVPPYSIVVGYPGKVVSKRFSYKEISDLMRVKWWHWKDCKIEAGTQPSHSRIFRAASGWDSGWVLADGRKLI